MSSTIRVLKASQHPPNAWGCSEAAVDSDLIYRACAALSGFEMDCSAEGDFNGTDGASNAFIGSRRGRQAGV